MLRLMLLIPLVRQFMLLDIGVFPDGSEDYEEPPFKQLDDLVALHMRAMQHMQKLNWPIGSPHQVPVGKRWVERGRLREGYVETVYESHFGVTCMPNLVFMRSGAIYGTVDEVADNGDTGRVMGLLDLALVDDETRSYIVHGLESMLSLRPEPLYIDT